MNPKPFRHPIPHWFAGLLTLFLLFSAGVSSSGPTEPSRDLTAEEVVKQALIDTLYYDFEKWFEFMENKVTDLEKEPESVERDLELMKYRFYNAGLYTEYSHVLAFTSKYQVGKVKEQVAHNIYEAKRLAQKLIEDPSLQAKQRAEAFLYLGASEGYLGIFEYGEGNLIKAIMNGIRADNHLEEALEQNPRLVDAHLGLGIYQYGNSRLGGVGNFLLQGGADLRYEGLLHLEKVVKAKNLSHPLAIKTLIWFYLSEEINPANKNLPHTHPLSPAVCRKRVIELLDDFERQYFKDKNRDTFIGNKGLAMMRAIQYVLDEQYDKARDEFDRVVAISDFLEAKKDYKINPQLVETARAGKKFTEVMRSKTVAKPESQCREIQREISFLDGGGSIVDYDSKKIRAEIQDIFYGRLVERKEKLQC